MDPDSRVAAAWDAEYRSGRYASEPAVALVEEILREARSRGISSGLDLGCGNGRNYGPLVDGGLDLLGLDVSSEAIRQLAARRPDRADRLRVGDLSALPVDARFPLVVGIQVFQHGVRAACHHHLRAAQARVEARGLFALRVNAVGTEYEYAHEVVERGADGSVTVRYVDGPKRGLPIHFFDRAELERLFADEFDPVVGLRRSVTVRTTPAGGHWDQWEAIWQRRGPRAAGRA